MTLFHRAIPTLKRYNLARLVFKLIVFFPFSAYSQMAVDQSHTGENNWYTCLMDSQILGQSFTAGTTGYLSAVEIDFAINCNYRISDYTFYVDILEGSGFAGNILATKKVTVGTPFERSMVKIYFLTAPLITSGETYTIRLSPLANQYCPNFLMEQNPICAIWYESATDEYANGQAYLNGTQDNVYDKYFRTYVSACLPTSKVQGISACDSHTWIDGKTYSTSNSVAVYLTQNKAGCDSIVHLDLTVSKSTCSIDFVKTTTPFTWIDGVTYTTSNNTATYLLTNSAGCDSLVWLDLTIEGTDLSAVDQAHEGVNNWYTCLMPNQTLGQSFTAERTGYLTAVEMDFSVNNFPENTDHYVFTVELLEGAGFNGDVLATKVVRINLPTTRTKLKIDFVNTPEISSGRTYTIRAAAGNSQVCDAYFANQEGICGIWYESQTDSYAGGVGYLNGQQDNVYDKYFVTHVVEACPSVNSTDVVTACDSYTWIDGITYTTSNNSATFKLTSKAGCDSTVHLNLTIKESTSSTQTVSACNSYLWIDGNTYTTSNNSATFKLTNKAGCDSTVYLNLTIKKSSSSTHTLSACDSYKWIDGNTYTTSNNSATFKLTNKAGCDSTVYLNLTIKKSSSSTHTLSACDSYKWIDGNTYTTSNNSATFTLLNKAGCDSVVHLNLTVNNSKTSIHTVSACDSYSWIDGKTYTASNSSATFKLLSTSGCDSLVSLNLTIKTVDASVSVIPNLLTAETNGASYQWVDCETNQFLSDATTQSFSPLASGSYAVKVSLNGCSATSECFSMIVTDIAEEFGGLKVYPNPTDGKFVVSIPWNMNGGRLKIVNTHGQILSESNISGSETVELSIAQGAGIYFLAFISRDGKSFLARIIRE